MDRPDKERLAKLEDDLDNLAKAGLINPEFMQTGDGGTLTCSAGSSNSKVIAFPVPFKNVPYILIPRRGGAANIRNWATGHDAESVNGFTYTISSSIALTVGTKWVAIDVTQPVFAKET